MNYIVFDLEFNQQSKTDNNNVKSDKNCPFEIIQIGAVKLDEHLNLVDKFNYFIKPNIYPVLNPYVKKLTSISMDILKDGYTFDYVYKKLTEFVSLDDIFVVWGKCDMKELLRNIKYCNLDTSILSNNFIDIQKYASKYFKYTKGKQIGLNVAIDLLSISVDGHFHDAFNDAIYTSKIFQLLYNKNIKIEKYSYNPRPKTIKATSKVDYNALFSQFEKMLRRSLSKDEKFMIKTSYLMGKTNQFSINNNSKNPD